MGYCESQSETNDMMSHVVLNAQSRKPHVLSSIGNAETWRLKQRDSDDYVTEIQK
jgi:hypothetical protein